MRNLKKIKEKKNEREREREREMGKNKNKKKKKGKKKKKPTCIIEKITRPNTTKRVSCFVSLPLQPFFLYPTENERFPPLFLYHRTQPYPNLPLLTCAPTSHNFIKPRVSFSLFSLSVKLGGPLRFRF